MGKSSDMAIEEEQRQEHFYLKKCSKCEERKINVEKLIDSFKDIFIVFIRLCGSVLLVGSFIILSFDINSKLIQTFLFFCVVGGALLFCVERGDSNE